MKHVYAMCFCALTSLSVLAQWTDNTAENLSVAGMNASDMHAIGVGEGKTWVAWYSKRDDDNYELRAQLIDSTGHKLLGDAGILVSNELAGTATYEFNICSNGRYDLIIGHQYERNDTLVAVVSKLDQQGNLLWSSNGVVLGAGLSPYPSVLANGETAVVWNSSLKNTLLLQRITSDGVLASDKPMEVKVGSKTTTRGQVVANLNSDFTLVFQVHETGINTTLYAQRYDLYGKPYFTSPLQLSNLATSGARYYSVLADYDTTYVGYYASEGSRFNSYVQRINPDNSNPMPYGMNGAAFSTRTGATDPNQMTTSIAFKDSSQVLWAVCNYSNQAQSESGVFIQKFEKTTGQRGFNTYAREVLPISNMMDMQVGELAVTGEDRPGFIVHDTRNHLYAIKLDNRGYPVWTAKSIELGSSDFPKARFSFASNDVIGVAVWSEDRGNGAMPFAQNITPEGVTGVLPVVIADFTAVKSGIAANLSWSTLTETNNKGFSIERSQDGRSFTAIGFVASVGNNSAQQNHYAFADKAPLNNDNYYRLQQVDLNGKTTYSDVKMVSFRQAAALVISRLYPNPASSLLQVQLWSAVNSKATISITNVNGKTVLQQHKLLMAGDNLLPITVQSLSAGTYFIRVNANGTEKVMKFSKL